MKRNLFRDTISCFNHVNVPSLMTLMFAKRGSILSKFRNLQRFHIFSSPEPKALGELIGWDSSRRPSVRPLTLADMNISETSWPIIIKFHLTHHWGGRLAAFGLGKIGSEFWFP